MKGYILTDADFDKLLLMLDRDPQHGAQGGSSDVSVNDPGKRVVYVDAHRFYNYQIHKWLDEVKR
jgi:hypothetical protein